MRIVKAGVKEIIESDPLKKIEICGRTCYKSENKITEGSAVDFVHMLRDRKHLAMTEHATLAIVATKEAHLEDLILSLRALGHGTYINVTTHVGTEGYRWILSGNVRAWLNLFNNGKFEMVYKYMLWSAIKRDKTQLSEVMYPFEYEWPILDGNVIRHISVYNQDELLMAVQDLSEKEKLKHLYYTAHFVCDRGVSHELVRHRPCSFAQESTRYCNYSKDKFGKEITVVQPLWIEGDLTGSHKIEWYDSSPSYDGEWTGAKPGDFAWFDSMAHVERTYFSLLETYGWSAQQARDVLPNSLKTEIIMTANMEEWNIIFGLRLPESAHPQMREVMHPWYHILLDKSELANVIYM